ncbi:MAG: site-2 protease family protein [Candidatus Altiarchaeota archaeon]
MNLHVLLLIFFAVGTFLLSKTKFERHAIIFLIRTKYFLKFIEGTANISKKFWKFFADLAIIFSFSALGVKYISKYNNCKVAMSILTTGIIFSLFFSKTIMTFLILIFLFVILSKSLENVKSENVNFFVFSVLLSFIWFKILSGILLNFPDFSVLVITSIIAGTFGIPTLVVISFIHQGYLIIFENLNTPGISPFIPSVEKGEIVLSAPGTGFSIPILYALFAITIAIFSHEFAHGILACANRIKLKSTGIATLGILPIGAFVEPDEDEMNKKDTLTRSRIFAVGSFSNFLVAVVFLFIWYYSPILFSSFSDGVIITGTQPGYSAYEKIKTNTIVYEINSIRVRNIAEFQNEMSKLKPMDELILKTNYGEISLIASENPKNPNSAYLGVILIPHIPEFLSETLFWTFFINFSIALVNLLPLIPLDGGRIFKEFIFSFKISKKMQERIFYSVATLTLFLIFVNILPLFRMTINFISGLF